MNCNISKSWRVFAVLLTLAVVATGAPSAAAEEVDGFKPLFDGKTLEGWESPDMSYWSVENGAITGKITPEHPLKVNQYLVWREPMGDFELKMKFRMFGSPGINSGFQFRSRLLPGHDMAGYQMDNNLDTPWLARLYEEHGRDTLAYRGKKAAIDADGNSSQTDIPDAGGPAWFRLERWHEYHLVCRGSHLILHVNGRLAAEALDGDTKQRALSGLLGLQLHSGPPTTVQFKNIRLRRLAPGDKLSRPTALATLPPRRLIQDKTLVAWVTAADLVQRGGSVLTLDDHAGHFDGIVLGELVPGKWMAGSNFFQRTEKDQKHSPAETADPKTLLQLAIVYQGCQVRIYRNGIRYAEYAIGEPQQFGPGSAVIMGLRHFGAGGPAHFAGTIDDARIYDRALSTEQIAALRPGQPSEPKPLAWFSFEGHKAVDRMGKFPVVDLLGGAHVADGKLHLDGKGAYLVGTENAESQYPSPIHYRPRRGVFADPIPFFWKGEYHVFYLRGAAGPVPWEHIVSRDLVHWEELPTALKVDGAPDGPDGGAMFTGSVLHGQGQFHIFYTGDNGANPKGNEFIMHATSPDLLAWTKHPEEIIAPDPTYYKNTRTRDFRDPYVSWNDQEKCYWMVFFANDAKTGAGVQGRAVSKDLKHWEFQPPLPGAGGQECPDLFKIGDVWYLIGGDRYSIAKDPHGPYAKPPVSDVIDRPFVYAAKRMFDGRRHIWTGWLWDRAGFCDSGQSQWGGTQCLPRELYAGPGGQLYCRPVPEVSVVFTKCVLDLARKPALAAASGGWHYTAEGLAGNGDAAGSSCAIRVPDHYMLQCKLALDPKAIFTLTMRQGEDTGSGYALELRPGKQEAEISSDLFREPRRIELDASRPISIQAFVQGSMIETFINDQYALSCRAYDYPTGKLGLAVRGGGVKVLELKAKVCAAPNPQGTVKE
jgi:sucrose-6-phosphate hydrolase SacC (GH32 family)